MPSAGIAASSAAKSAARPPFPVSLESEKKADAPVSATAEDPRMRPYAKSPSAANAADSSSLEACMLTSAEFAQMFHTAPTGEAGSEGNSRDAESFSAAWRKASGQLPPESGSSRSSAVPAFAGGNQPNGRGQNESPSTQQVLVPRLSAAGETAAGPWRLASTGDPGVKHCIRRPDGVYVQVDPSQVVAGYPVVTGAGFSSRVVLPGASSSGVAYSRQTPHSAAARRVVGFTRKGTPGTESASERSSGITLVGSDGSPTGVAPTGSWLGNWLRHTASSR